MNWIPLVLLGLLQTGGPTSEPVVVVKDFERVAASLASAGDETVLHPTHGIAGDARIHLRLAAGRGEPVELELADLRVRPLSSARGVEVVHPEWRWFTEGALSPVARGGEFFELDLVLERDTLTLREGERLLGRRELSEPLLGVPRLHARARGVQVSDFVLSGVVLPADEVELLLRERAVEAAIARGIAHLRSMQCRDGSWSGHENHYRNGLTAMCLYTMLKSGVSRNDPAVRRGFAYLELQRPTRTYELALELMALAERRRPQDREWMSDLTTRLVESTSQDGMWAYEGNRYDRPHSGDLSNTQYGALGLRAAWKSGIRVPDETWLRLIRGVLRCRPEKASSAGRGFTYRANSGPERVTGSMTAAGLATLELARKALGERIPPELEEEVESALAQGTSWLARRFSVTENPGTDGHLHYYLYGLERAGAILDTTHFGAHDWYAEGSEVLLESQRTDGGFGNLSRSCFGLLFLMRATAVSSRPSDPEEFRSWTSAGDGNDVVLHATGEDPLTLWIAGFREELERDLEHGRLSIERIEYVVDGEVIESLRRPHGERWDETQRFAIQHALPGPGRYWVGARVYASDPENRRATGVRTLRSGAMRIDARTTEPGYLFEYATAQARNELRHVEVRARASSTERNREAGLAVDGHQTTAWQPDLEDRTPRLTLEFEPPVRAREILVGQLDSSGHVQGRVDVARKLRLTWFVGSAERTVEVECAQGFLEKTVARLPEPQRIRRLDIELLDFRFSRKDRRPRARGVAEVEVRSE